MVSLYLVYGSIIFNYFLIFILLYFRTAFISAFKLKFMTMLGHDYNIVRIFGEDKRVRKYVVEVDKDIRQFVINGGVYMVDPNKAYFEGSIPSFTYIEGSYNPIDPSNIGNIAQVDPILVNKVVLRAKATGKLAEWLKQNKTLLMLIGGTLLLGLATAYFSYRNNQFLTIGSDLNIEGLLTKYCSKNIVTG